MDNNSLAHWGVLGMKWGVRRYQNKDGSLTKAGKKRYGDSDGKTETKEEYEARKQKAIKSGSASEILKFKGDLTSAEMRSVAERIRWEQDMQNISSKEVSAGKARADKFFSKVDDVTKYANSSIKAYNTFANIFNAFSDREVSLPKISTDIDKGNKETRKKEKKEQNKAEEAKKKREEQEAQKDEKRKERAEKKAKGSDKKSDPDTEVYDGPVEVMGEGTSRSKSSGGKNKSSSKDTITMDSTSYRDISDDDVSFGRDYTNSSPSMNKSFSSVPQSSITSGQQIIAGLLEEPK